MKDEFTKRAAGVAGQTGGGGRKDLRCGDLRFEIEAGLRSPQDEG